MHMKGLDRLPGRFLAEPEAIADVVAFLCHPASRAICGQTLVADQGLSNALRALPDRDD